MASPSSSRRRPREDDDEGLEDGEFVPSAAGCCYSSEDDAERYSVQSRRSQQEETETRRPPPPLMERASVLAPSWYECESDKSISDDDRGRQHRPSVVVVIDAPVIISNWTTTGKRGGTGGRNKGSSINATAVSASDEPNHSSMAKVVSSEPTPLQPAMKPPSSARSNLVQSGETSSPQSIHNNEPAAGSASAVVHQNPAPPSSTQLDRLVALKLAPPSNVPRREYKCNLCSNSYPSPQGLGGHMAGHRNRKKQAEAAASAAGLVGPDGNAIPAAARQDREEEEHPCQKCDKAFPTGVALGGHMRAHYKGPPIEHKRKSKKQCVAPPLPPPPVVSALPAPLAVAVANLTQTLIRIEATQPSHSPPPVTGMLRLFGVDIVQPPPPAEASSSVVQHVGPPPAQAPTVQQGNDIRPQADVPVVQEGNTDEHAEAPHRKVLRP